MISQLFTYMYGLTISFYDWFMVYWLDMGIAVSMLTAIVLGVVQVIDQSDREIHPRRDFSDHDVVMVRIFFIGAFIAWLPHWITIVVSWIVLLTLPLTVGYFAARLYEHNKYRVKLPKASIENTYTNWSEDYKQHYNEDHSESINNGTTVCNTTANI